MKTRTYVFTKPKYTKEEVMDIVGEIIEESKLCSFNNYKETYLNERDFQKGEEHEVVYSKKVPELTVLE